LSEINPESSHPCVGVETIGFTARIPMSKRFRAKLREIKTELRARRYQPLTAQGTWLGTVLRGYYRYYGVPSNINALGRFRIEVTRLWFRSLRRWSQKRRLRWDRMTHMSTDRCQPHESVILGLGIGSTLVLKIGAECSNSVCWDLCGGPGETLVPTATPSESHHPLQPPRRAPFILFSAGSQGLPCQRTLLSANPERKPAIPPKPNLPSRAASKTKFLPIAPKNSNNAYCILYSHTSNCQELEAAGESRLLVARHLFLLLPPPVSVVRVRLSRKLSPYGFRRPKYRDREGFYCDGD
jgi:hypothetical protein